MEYVVTRHDNSDDELMHYGVLGMKWGKRTVRGHAGPGQYLTKKRQMAGDKRDLDTLNKGGHLSVGLTKKRQAAYDKRDRAKIEKRQSQADPKAAKIARKNAIKTKTKELNKQASFGEKLTYNNATRKKAAKYIVNNNMSVSAATKKAKGEAWRNTAIFVGTYGAIGLAAYKTMR